MKTLLMIAVLILPVFASGQTLRPKITRNVTDGKRVTKWQVEWDQSRRVSAKGVSGHTYFLQTYLKFEKIPSANYEKLFDALDERIYKGLFDDKRILAGGMITGSTTYEVGDDRLWEIEVEWIFEPRTEADIELTERYFRQVADFEIDGMRFQTRKLKQWVFPRYLNTYPEPTTNFYDRGGWGDGVVNYSSIHEFLSKRAELRDFLGQTQDPELVFKAMLKLFRVPEHEAEIRASFKKAKMISFADCSSGFVDDRNEFHRHIGTSCGRFMVRDCTQVGGVPGGFCLP